ncbi:Retrovirus-related Pol polyprotein from transposon RE1 [Vitis vinifera]|uniref:Retrovirus-related Pol polyprotein from transposon RE1 n=1 Tax=Vitis vinifera TaxID=29760 RepID=A0A438F1T4_VITVI|nr:Retrovirus-related Pol polyprotein from transposon RE1 [Vitis vinifera]
MMIAQLAIEQSSPFRRLTEIARGGDLMVHLSLSLQAVWCSVRNKRMPREPMVACHMLLLATRGGCLHDSFDLIWVDLYPLLSDHKPQKLVCAYPKGTFGWIELHFVTIGSTWHPSMPIQVNHQVTPSSDPYQPLKGDDCFVANCAIIMTTKVKKSSQHRCDTIPDPIKALLQLNIEAGNRDDLSSTTAYIVYLGGNAISQCSCKQKSITHSSTEAEYDALASTTVEVLWVHSLLGTLKATNNG